MFAVSTPGYPHGNARDIAESRQGELPPVWTAPDHFFRDRSELARDLRRLADDIAPAAGEMRDTDRGGRRVVSSEVRRINGRSVTVQRRRASFAIFVNG
jgi:hypothetical protein